MCPASIGPTFRPALGLRSFKLAAARGVGDKAQLALLSRTEIRVSDELHGLPRDCTARPASNRCSSGRAAVTVIDKRRNLQFRAVFASAAAGLVVSLNLTAVHHCDNYVACSGTAKGR